MSELNYQPFSEELFKNTITAVIDADSFAYAIGWNNREALFPEPVIRDVDALVHDILQGTQARHYIGILSPDSTTIIGEEEVQCKPNFRKAIALSRPYKGMRAEKPEWYVKWAPIINNHLIDKWGFIKAPEGYEADDLTATMCQMIADAGGNATCCGNDKDLLQIPGNHFNIVKKVLQHVDNFKANYTLWMQVLTGDSTDNIEGIPGCGPKSAEKILTVSSSFGIADHCAVLSAYIEKHGQDIGIQKFYENYMLVKLRFDIDLELVNPDCIRGYDLETGGLQFKAVQDEFEQIPDFGAAEEMLRQGEDLNFGIDE
jgi:hypothetical protein